jgi:DNA-3-methyladenine glycosylase II
MTAAKRAGPTTRPSDRLAGQHPDPTALADRAAREFLRKADPTLARLIDARPDFRPRRWTTELPRLDAFGTLIFQVIGQQLSVSATLTIVSRRQERFGGRMPWPLELLAVDPQELRAGGMSNRKAATLCALAGRFVDGRAERRGAGAHDR